MQYSISQIQSKFLKGTKYTLMFSGGIDSSSILGAAIAGGIDITPVWIDNGLNRATAEEISKQAKMLGADNLNIINVKPNEQVYLNPINRCYFCKSQILSNINKSGYTIVDGTTKSDIGNYRPGSKALIENSVTSVLADCGIDKMTATNIAIYFGADQQLAAMESCLATRINYNMKITHERLGVIRKIERFVISETGDYNVRCRIDDDDHMRIEIKETDALLKIMQEDFRKKIIELNQGITMFVTVDLKSTRPNEYDKKN